MKGHKGHHFRQRAAGGKAMVVSGNPNVLKEAREGKTGDEGRKRGGKVIGRMAGGPVKARLDRPGRKKGGGVGANTKPLSTAKKVASPSESSKPTDTYGGTPAD
jgi:hypothetical protein